MENPGVAVRGSASFSSERFTEAEAHAYQELWNSINLPEQREFIEHLASEDNLYNYGRRVQTYIGSLLLVLRYTGDPALLDRVDDLTQLMREQLDDSWRSTPRGADRSPGRDGYLNWVWRKDDSRAHLGRDLHETDEIRTHALIAEIAWAFQLNRNLASPSGLDYGERAEFWLDYLENHFEAKWRERSGVRWPRFPFLQRPYVHPTLAMTKYHYYMYRLTGERPYLQEAMRLSDILFDEFYEVETAAAPAYVWRRSILSLGGDEDYLMPTDYSSLVIVDALSLHLDGFYGWADPRIPRGLASTVANFLLDDDTEGMARDVGGGETRAGIRASSTEWDRPTSTQFAINSFSLLSRWDDSGKIERVARAIYDDLPDRHRYVYIPAGLFLAEHLRSAEPSEALDSSANRSR